MKKYLIPSNVFAMIANAEKKNGVKFQNAVSVDVTSNYSGDVADAILRAIKLGNEAVEKGSVYVEPGVQLQLSIPIMTTLDDVLQNAEADPSTPSEAFTWTENVIVPKTMMFYDEINPRNFEAAWRPFQPTGALVDRVDNPRIQTAIIEETTKTAGKQLGKLVWQGDTAGAAALAFFDGYIKKFTADPNVVAVTPAGVITASNVIAILEDCEAAIPAAIWQDPAVVFHMSTADFRLYQQAARALDFKGANIGDAMEERFAGREIRYYNGLPKDRIVVCKATAGKDSNLWAAIDVAGDETNVKIGRKNIASELFVVKLLFKFGVGYGIGSEIVFYEPS